MASYQMPSNDAVNFDLFGQYGFDYDEGNPLNSMFKRIAAGNYGAAQSRNASNQALEPQYQNALQELLSSFRTSPAAESAAANERIAANSARVKRRAGVSGPASAGLKSGVSNSIDLNTAGQMNQSDAAIYDPQRHQQQVMQLIQTLSGAQQNNPFLGQIMQGAQAQNQHRQVTAGVEASSSSPWEAVAGLAGGLAGGGAFNKLF